MMLRSQGWLDWREALRACIDRKRHPRKVTLAAVETLIATSPDNSTLTLTVLRAIAQNTELSAEIRTRALRAIPRLNGPDALLTLKYVKNPEREKTAALCHEFANLEGSESALRKILRHRSANPQLRWEALVALIKLGGPSALRSCVWPLLIRGFDSGVEMLLRLLNEADELFSAPDLIVAELVDLFSSPSPGPLKSVGSGRGTKNQRRRLSRLNKRVADNWQRFIYTRKDREWLLDAVRRLAVNGAWDSVEKLVVEHPGRIVGLAAAELVARNRPSRAPLLLLRALTRSNSRWIAQRYVQLLSGHADASAFAAILRGGATADAKIAAAEVLARECGPTLDRPAMDALMECATSATSMSVRRAALTSLGAFNCREVVLFLADVSASSDLQGKEKRSAQRALQQLGSELLSSVLPHRAAKTASQAIAEFAAGQKRRRGRTARELSDAVTTLRKTVFKENVSPALEAALGLLDMKKTQAAAAHSISLSVRSAAAFERRSNFNWLTANVDRNLEILRQEPDDPGVRPKLRAAARHVAGEIVARAVQACELEEKHAPRTVALRKVMLHALTYRPRSARNDRQRRASQVARRWGEARSGWAALRS